MGKPVLHFLYGFLLNPMIDLGSLHGKIGSLHNDAKPTILECRQQSVEHSQGKAAPNKDSPVLNIFLTRDLAISKYNQSSTDS